MNCAAHLLCTSGPLVERTATCVAALDTAPPRAQLPGGNPDSLLRALLQPGKVDKRTGDPEAGGKTSGQKAVRLLSNPCVPRLVLLCAHC